MNKEVVNTFMLCDLTEHDHLLLKCKYDGDNCKNDFLIISKSIFSNSIFRVINKKFKCVGKFLVECLYILNPVKYSNGDIEETKLVKTIEINTYVADDKTFLIFPNFDMWSNVISNTVFEHTKPKYISIFSSKKVDKLNNKNKYEIIEVKSDENFSFSDDIVLSSLEGSFATLSIVNKCKFSLFEIIFHKSSAESDDLFLKLFIERMAKYISFDDFEDGNSQNKVKKIALMNIQNSVDL